MFNLVVQLYCIYLESTSLFFDSSLLHSKSTCETDWGTLHSLYIGSSV